WVRFDGAVVYADACNHEEDDEYWRSDASGHWYICKHCTEKFNFSEHTFLEGRCAECHYRCEHLELEEWTDIVYAGKPGHCKYCVRCREVINGSAGACTINESNGHCDVCKMHREDVWNMAKYGFNETEHWCPCMDENCDKRGYVAEHTWGEWNETIHATCTAEGKEKHICSLCNQEGTRPINALGHTWGEWKVIKEPTTDAEGKERRECINNSAHFEERAIAKLPYEIIDQRTDDGYTLGSGKDMVITATPTSRKFVDLYMDEVLVDRANYKLEEGSTKITLKATYMKTLTPGKHTMRLHYTDGDIVYPFNVLAAETTPKTGDSNAIGLFIALAVLSIGGVVVVSKSAKEQTSK
ncbi:MAG: hypothetical protein IJR47_04845, partial [Clostridia bacterium]|nr:hypothetical protein [Clostridia bacterium]